MLNQFIKFKIKFLLKNLIIELKTHNIIRFYLLTKFLNLCWFRYNRSWWPMLDMNWKPQQLSIFFSIHKTLESPILANFNITHFVQDFVSKNNLRKSVELSKSSNDFKKNLHCIFIFFTPILMIDLMDTITVF